MRARQPAGKEPEQAVEEIPAERLVKHAKREHAQQRNAVCPGEQLLPSIREAPPERIDDNCGAQHRLKEQTRQAATDEGVEVLVVRRVGLDDLSVRGSKRPADERRAELAESKCETK